MKSVEAIVETCLMEMNIPAHYVRNKALITRAIHAALAAHDEAQEWTEETVEKILASNGGLVAIAEARNAELRNRKL